MEAGSTAAFVGVELKVNDALIPPGGTLQFQLRLTEPKPIGHGSTRPRVPGAISGIALNDSVGQTAGVAILDATGIRVNFTSPLATFGSSVASEAPILTIRSSIPANTPVGQQFPLSIDVNNSFWFDPTGQPYPQAFSSGELTIGGTLAISDVHPGGGFQPAGTRLTIRGMGFRPDSRVNIEGVTVVTSNVHFVSANEIDVVLPSGLLMDGARVRVRNPDQRATFFAYFHATEMQKSTHPLLARTYPLFARATRTTATLPWKRTGTQFTGLALQNPGASPANISVQMRSAAGDILGSLSFVLPAETKITRDLLEFFAGAPAAGVSVHVISSQPVQMLGLLGDDSSGDVVPVVVSAP